MNMPKIKIKSFGPEIIPAQGRGSVSCAIKLDLV
jgi:hypothetical protein